MSGDLKLATMNNRHPADELAEVREKIHALKSREEALRSKLLTGEVGLAGDEFEASVTTSKAEKISTSKLKRELGMAFLRPYVSTVESTVVRVKRKAS